MSAWPEPVERVAAYLRAAGAEARVEEFGDGARTAQDAARSIGCELAQIAKSLVVECDGRPVVVLVPGNRRADLQKVARALGCRDARVARADVVETATGFAPGAVAPFPLPTPVRVLVDRSLLFHDVVWVGAGSIRHMTSIPPSELVRVARARPIDAAQEDA